MSERHPSTLLNTLRWAIGWVMIGSPFGFLTALGIKLFAFEGPVVDTRAIGISIAASVLSIVVGQLLFVRKGYDEGAASALVVVFLFYSFFALGSVAQGVITGDWTDARASTFVAGAGLVLIVVAAIWVRLFGAPWMRPSAKRP